MKNKNREDYKEYVFKTIWNSNVNKNKRKQFYIYGIKFDPFAGITFKKSLMMQKIVKEHNSKFCQRKERNIL